MSHLLSHPLLHPSPSSTSDPLHSLLSSLPPPLPRSGSTPSWSAVLSASWTPVPLPKPLSSPSHPTPRTNVQRPVLPQPSHRFSVRPPHPASSTNRRRSAQAMPAAPSVPVASVWPDVARISTAVPDGVEGFRLPELCSLETFAPRPVAPQRPRIRPGMRTERAQGPATPTQAIAVAEGRRPRNRRRSVGRASDGVVLGCEDERGSGRQRLAITVHEHHTEERHEVHEHHNHTHNHVVEHHHHHHHADGGRGRNSSAALVRLARTAEAMRALAQTEPPKAEQVVRDEAVQTAEPRAPAGVSDEHILRLVMELVRPALRAAPRAPASRDEEVDKEAERWEWMRGAWNDVRARLEAVERRGALDEAWVRRLDEKMDELLRARPLPPPSVVHTSTTTTTTVATVLHDAAPQPAQVLEEEVVEEEEGEEMEVERGEERAAARKEEPKVEEDVDGWRLAARRAALITEAWRKALISAEINGIGDGQDDDLSSSILSSSHDPSTSTASVSNTTADDVLDDNADDDRTDSLFSRSTE
jgi:hypothetical protein